MRGRLISSGPEDFSLISDQLYVDGQPVTPGSTVEVDPELSHRIRLKHNVANADPRSWGDPVGIWSTCITIYNETDKKTVGYDRQTCDGGSGGDEEANPAQVSVGEVTKPTKFRVKLWANQNDNAPPPDTGYW